MRTSRILAVRGRLAAAILAGVALAFCAQAGAAIPAHPDQLKYEDLKYDPPRRADYRHVLSSGAVAYVAENHEVPTFEMTVYVRAGSLYEPREKAGLMDMTGYLMRNGGVTGMDVKALDEKLAYLAGEINVDIGESEGRASLFCLAKDADEALALFKRVLKDPVFSQEALDRRRADVLSDMEQRNASTAGIENREWEFLIYGDHPCTNNMRTTKASIEGLTREGLIASHDKYFFPKNFIIAVSGDFQTKDVLKKLDALFADWPSHELVLPAISDQIPAPKAGVYMIAKPDVNQSRIRIGHLGVKRDNPDQYALMVMNDILGGGGFTSRIVQRVRSDEGLAYNAGSAFSRPVLYPGTFSAWFQTKHATAAFGTRLMVDEIRRIASEKCDAEAVENSKAGFVAEIVTPFSNKNMMVNTMADDEFTGRAEDYWQNYRKNIEAVTADDVLAVAQKYLHPDQLVFLVVGDPQAVEAGSDKHPERFSDFGPITILPLRDPMTLEAR